MRMPRIQQIHGLNHGFAALVCLFGCQQPASVSYTPSASQSPVAGANQTPVVSNPTASGSPVATNVVSPDDYPQVELYGNGILKSIDENPIHVRVRQEPSATRVITRTVSFNSDSGTIDKEVKKLAGSTTYERVTRVELAEMEKAPRNFRNETFMMFAKSSVTTNENGTISLAYSQPMPFLIIPSPMRQYETLPNHPATYTYKVRDVAGTFEFEVVSSLEEVSREGTIIVIKQFNQITTPNLSDMSFYDKLPVPQQLIYHIDTAVNKLVRLETSGPYFNKHFHEERNVSVDFKLCSVTVKGAVQPEPGNPCP